MEPLAITLEEFYVIIGELEVTKRKQQFLIQDLYNRIEEKNAELAKLREENGRLGKTNNTE